MSDLDNISKFYVNRKDTELLALAEELWKDKLCNELSAVNGEICRYAMLAAFRRARANKANESYYYAYSLAWKSRARVRFHASASFTGEAMMLIPDAYAVAFEFGQKDLAREILHEMPRLNQLDNRSADDKIPSKAMVERCYPEKLAYLYFKEQLYSEGKEWYQKAVDAANTNNDIRGKIKAQLGLANCNFGMSRGSILLRNEMERIRDEAIKADFPDVAYVSKKNLDLPNLNSATDPQELQFVEI